MEAFILLQIFVMRQKNQQNIVAHLCSNRQAKKHNVPKRVTELDDFQKDVVRRTVLQYYDKGEYPTAKKLHWK